MSENAEGKPPGQRASQAISVLANVIAVFAFIRDNFGIALIFVFGGLSATSIALITYSIRRMSVSRAFSYSYLIIYSVSAVPGFLFICVALTAGIMRPERSPQLQHWLYQLGFLSFSGTMGVFLIDGAVVEIPAITPPTEAPLASFRLQPGERRTVPILTIPVGGSNYPVALVVRTGPPPQPVAKKVAQGVRRLIRR